VFLPPLIQRTEKLPKLKRSKNGMLFPVPLWLEDNCSGALWGPLGIGQGHQCTKDHGHTKAYHHKRDCRPHFEPIFPVASGVGGKLSMMPSPRTCFSMSSNSDGRKSVKFS
jgi:hypothetical protein